MALKPEISSELRTMVREVLREAIAGKATPSLATVESVRLSCDGDLAAFVSRLMDPAVQDRVRAGKLRFTLGAAPVAQTPPAAAALTGVISEKTVDRHAGSGTLLLAPDAVLTPLARDRARQLKLKIERRR